MKEKRMHALGTLLTNEDPLHSTTLRHQTAEEAFSTLLYVIAGRRDSRSLAFPARR